MNLKYYTGAKHTCPSSPEAGNDAAKNMLTVHLVCGHNFRAYAKNWFAIYSDPNIERATAQTYQRQLTCHIYPALGDMDVEDITTDHIQMLFNGMDLSKVSKDKTRIVLHMIFEMALDDGIIEKNPIKSKRLRITGRASEPTEEYTIEQTSALERAYGIG